MLTKWLVASVSTGGGVATPTHRDSARATTARALRSTPLRRATSAPSLHYRWRYHPSGPVYGRKTSQSER
ncbi:hypothetical protein L2E82_14159 [Cichorium intybus]|uniref:Uncharacterized protein n=1 Tax=Cichorium intybus TaxID=13427 RepID=A0ACB9F0D7_CICIN|nr:hypothetical protein L2E82_14159 [Cichorium intybus]